MAAPLADRIRPASLDEVVGQKHILGEGKALRRILDSGNIPNLIFYGPSGVGKTTVARIIAERADMRLHKLNGTTGQHRRYQGGGGGAGHAVGGQWRAAVSG